MVKKRLMAFALSLCMVLVPVMEASAAGTVSDGDAANTPVTLSEDAASDSGTTVSGNEAEPEATPTAEPSTNGGGADEDALETVYLYEDFEDAGNYAAGVILEATTAAVDPVTIGQITYASGSRSGGSLHNKVTATTVGDSTGIEIYEERFVDASRGITMTFSDVPTVADLSDGETLEFSMDFSTYRNSTETGDISFTLTGYGDITIDEQTLSEELGHLSVVLNPTDSTQTITITDAAGTVLYISQDALTATSFTGLSFQLTTYTTTLIDNIMIVKKAAGSDTNENADIYSMEELPEVAVTSDEIADYAHPTTATANLLDGTSIEVEIDADSWSCEPTFDETVTNLYTWTANIIAPAEHANPKGLTVSYNMAYTVVTESTHDYENNFNFDVDFSDFFAWGKDMDSTSGTGLFDLSIGTDSNSTRYLYATVTGNGDRGSRLTISSEIVKAAEVTFDWMPINSNGKGNAQLLFLAPGQSHPYFGLRADTSYNLSFFTENPLTMCSTTQNAFEGSIAAGDAEGSTGLSGQNKWFTVSIQFDYINHTADLTITEKDTENTYTKTDIPIEKEANGLESFVIHMNKLDSGASVTQGINNLTVDYERFGELDIVDLEQPSDVNVAKVVYDEYEFPTEVTVTLGNGETAQVAVGDWTSDPEFDKDTVEGSMNVYTWTAPLVTDKYTNYFGLEATFTMNYTLLPYVTRVNNPSTLELEYGSAWSESELPAEVTVILSDGSVYTNAVVSEWNAIRAFDSENEGIYIYGANLVDTDEYVVIDGMYSPNEYHGDSAGDELKAEFVYDVYYRISYYKADEDNYNGYTRSMEYLDRGVTAITTSEGILVSWRLLVDEYATDIQFNVLRNGEIINSEPITTKTNYLDTAGKAGDAYAIQVITTDEVKVTTETTALADNYMSIALQKPDPQPDKDGNLATYTINDAGVADVDGDGQYEIVVKWYPSDAFDSGKQDGPSAPTIFDCYKLDGTALWRLNMGLECPSGAHWNQFMFYDLDEDGNAEFFIKTSDGTITYKPNADGLFDMTDASTIVSYIGDPSVIPGTNINSTGHANVNSNEYITVFNGMTGEEIDTIDYVYAVTDFMDYGDNWGNRASRFNIAIAYQPKDEGSTETIPTVLFNRGYYERTTVAAYTLRDGELQEKWTFDSDKWATDLNEDGVIGWSGSVSEHATSPYAGKGNHNVSTGDMDNDGFDELVIGALAIDHDGSVLWCKDGVDGQDYQGHSDTIHLAAMNPEDPTQLYVFTPSEHTESTLNGTLSNAENGSRINGLWTSLADIGRGVAANITPLPGYEYWANTPNNESGPTGVIYNFFGDIIAATPPSNFSTNWIAYWDGDLLSELADGYNPGGSGTEQTIYKYNWEENTLDVLEVFEGTHTNNSTKNNPSLTADLFGDWREEFIIGSADDTELRIYMTDYETDYMIYSLMQDPVYRNAVANQNTSYNQPPHVGFYLGEDNKDQVLAMQLPTANIQYTTTGTGVDYTYYRPEVDDSEETVNTKMAEDVEKESVQKLISGDTVDALRTYLTDDLVGEAANAGMGTLTADQVKVLDVKVMVKLPEQGWQEATEETFPAGGIDVTIPYPEGTGKDGFDFVISHLKNTGGVAQMEHFSGSDITKTDDGLVVHFTSASLVGVIFNLADASAATPTPDPGTTPTPAPGTTQTPAPVTTPQPETPSDSTQESSEEMDHANSFIDTYLRDKDGNIILSVTDDNKAQIIAGKDAWLKLTDAERAIVNNTVGNHAGMNYEDYLEKAGAPFTTEELKQSSVPKTGDHMGTAVIVWIIVLAAAAAGIGVVVVSKRRKKAE